MHVTQWENDLCGATIAKRVCIAAVGTPNHQVFPKDASHRRTGSGELDLEQCAYTALSGSCESRPLTGLHASAGSPSPIWESFTSE